MFRILIFLVTFMTSTLQLAAQNHYNEINDQVWKPFCEALMQLDTVQYLSVHSKELIRTERTNQKIYGYGDYAHNTKQGFEKGMDNAKKSPDIKFSVELRFLERAASHVLAYEIGYFKSMLTFPDGRKQSYFSQFHVSLKKENGRWKIFTDSSLPLPNFTEEEFQKAIPL